MFRGGTILIDPDSKRMIALKHNPDILMRYLKIKVQAPRLEKSDDESTAICSG